MSDRYEEWVELVLPATGAPAILRALLDMSPNVGDVRMQGNGDSVLIPPDLADAYNASIAPPKPPRKPRAKKEEAA